MRGHRGSATAPPEASGGACRTAGSGGPGKGAPCAGAAPAPKRAGDGNGTARNGNRGIRGGSAGPAGTFDTIFTPKTAKAFIYNLFFNTEII